MAAIILSLHGQSALSQMSLRYCLLRAGTTTARHFDVRSEATTEFGQPQHVKDITLKR